MAIVSAAALLAAGLVAAALLYTGAPGGRRGAAEPDAPALPLARDELEADLLERRGEIVRIEERVISKEEAIDAKLAELSRRDQRLDDRERELHHQRELLEERKREHLRELERVAGLTAAQAKQVLLKEVEDQARHDAAKVLRQVDEETKLQAERKVRNILSVCMGRLAATHASETTVSVVQLPSDDMKGRVIGREGRNIRALENLTGVDFIIDDTPHAVVLSGFDGVRREVARMTLEKLVADGRIHPARIEEVYCQSKAELEEVVRQAGEQAVFEANCGPFAEELGQILG